MGNGQAWAWRRGAAVAAALVATALPVPGASQAFESDSAWLASKGFWLRSGTALLSGAGETLRGWRARSLSAVVETLPLIEVRSVPGDRVFVLHADTAWRERDAEGGCALAVYLNGSRLQAPGEARPSIRSVERVLNVRDLAGVEIFAGDLVPVGNGELCGAVLFWSRRVEVAVYDEFAGRLRGRATWAPEGNPAGGIVMTLEPGERRQSTDSAGWFDFGAVLPGLYRITAAASDGATWTGLVVVRAYAISQVAIEVERREGGRW